MNIQKTLEAGGVECGSEFKRMQDEVFQTVDPYEFYDQICWETELDKSKMLDCFLADKGS